MEIIQFPVRIFLESSQLLKRSSGMSCPTFFHFGTLKIHYFLHNRYPALSILMPVVFPSLRRLPCIYGVIPGSIYDLFGRPPGSDARLVPMVHAIILTRGSPKWTGARRHARLAGKTRLCTLILLCWFFPPNICPLSEYGVLTCLL